MIVIIGAGLAGMAAAQRLTKLGRTDFIVIESHNYIGGRIKSEYINQTIRLDLGAQWLHGAKHNPIFDWLESMGCIDGPEEELVEFKGTFATQCGNIPSANVVSKIISLLLQAKNLMYKNALSMCRQAVTSRPIDVLQNYVKNEMSKCSVLRSADKRLVGSVVKWFELYEMIDNSCEDLTKLSMKAYSNWSDFDDGQMTKLKNGWQGVVDKLVDCVGMDKIRLNCVATQVEYSSEGVRVLLEHGEMIECDHVILTISIGALKRAIESNFFTPPIDKLISDEMKLIGFGPATKIFLHFNKPYLQEERGLKLLWLEQETTQDLPEWTKCVVGFDLVPGAQNLLLAWVGGWGAIEVEKIDILELGQVLLKLFAIFLPHKPAPELVSIHRSRWSTDVHIGGAYSYPSIELDVNEEVLEKKRNVSRDLWHSIDAPIGIPRILFAGEATARNMYATAHGAIVSGWREADRLIQHVL